MPKKDFNNNDNNSNNNSKDLDFYVALLITFNHSDVWNYGFSFFLKAIEVVQHIQKQAAYTMSTGIGLAFSTKEKQDIFLKEM